MNSTLFLFLEMEEYRKQNIPSYFKHEIPHIAEHLCCMTAMADSVAIDYNDEIHVSFIILTPGYLFNVLAVIVDPSAVAFHFSSKLEIIWWNN